jgi:hypothetical protein
MITYVAIPFQVYALTHSSLLVGLLGLAELLPLLVTALVGGAVADAFDRRRTVLVTEVAMVVLTACLLAIAAMPDPHVWPLFVVSGMFAAVDGLQRPSPCRRHRTRRHRPCVPSPRAGGTPAAAPSCSGHTSSTSTQCCSGCPTRCCRRSPHATAVPRRSACSTPRRPSVHCSRR